MSWDFIFPTRNGGSVGSSIENRMINKVGGGGTIRTEIQQLPDGSTVMLRTRNGFPEFTAVKKVEVIPVPYQPFTFQGLSISTTMQYGCTLSGTGLIAAATASTDQDALLWSMAPFQHPVSPVSLTSKSDGYKGNMDWRDTREPTQTRKVVTWRGLGGLARNTPYMVPVIQQTVTPFDYYGSTADDGKIWVDGALLPVIPNNCLVLCAAIYNNREVRAVCTIRPQYTHTYSGFIYGGSANLLLYSFQLSDGSSWEYVGEAVISGGSTYIWQTPVFNSSGTEFSGLIRQPTSGVSINEYPETEVTVSFSANPIITSVKGSKVGSFSSSSPTEWITANIKSTVLTMDYVGDVKHRLAYSEVTHSHGQSDPGTTYNGGTDTWEVIGSFSLAPELQVIAAQYGKTLADLSSNKLVKYRKTGDYGKVSVTRIGGSTDVGGFPVLTSPFDVIVKAIPAGYTQKSTTKTTSKKRFFSSNGLLLSKFDTERVVTSSYVIYDQATCIYSIQVVTYNGNLSSVDVTFNFSAKSTSVPATDITTTPVPLNDNAVTSIDLRSRTFTKTEDGVSICGVYENGENPGMGIGDELAYTLQPFSKSNYPALPTLPSAPLNHASHPDGGAAVITKSDYVTEFVTASIKTNIGELGCATGSNKILTSPIFFKRRLTS